MTFENVVFDAWTSLEPAALELPWESDAWKTVFGTSDDPPTVRWQRPLDDHTTLETRSPADHGQIPADRAETKKRRFSDHHSIVEDKPVESWKDERDAAWQTAVLRWKAAVEKWPESIQIVQMLHACSDHQATLNLLADFFVLKSPETLKKRINSLQFYMQFLDSINAPFPGSEALLYMFFCQLRDNGCVPSRMKGILEALSFTMYVFEIPSLEPLCKSRRCHGVASRKSNGPSRQADPLKVAELRCIHECLQDEVEDLWNRLAAGAILFAVYSRSRWSDLQHACKLEADVDDHGTCAYLEATVREFKTSSSAAFRNHFLSVVGPAVGVTNDNWAKTWMQVREDMMLDSIAQVPIMPAPDADGRATVRPIRTTEIGRWCEFILTKQGVELGDRKIRSHSFKCTTLSFAAKFGGNLDDRLILGGHVMPFRSVVTYSRGTIAGPIRFLERILLAIRNNSFFP